MAFDKIENQGNQGSIVSLPRYITSNRNPSECEIHRDLGSSDIRKTIYRPQGRIHKGLETDWR